MRKREKARKPADGPAHPAGTDAGQPGQSLDRERTIQELRAIEAQITAATGLPSRWRGEVEFSEEVDTHENALFSARKSLDCRITVHVACQSREDRSETYVHELLHGVSLGLTREAFERYPGFEEGTVEGRTRHLGPAISAAVGMPSRYRRAAYALQYAALEALRRETGKAAGEFYLSLLRTPLAGRHDTVVQWVMEADPQTPRAHMLVRLAPHLRLLRGE